MAEAGYADALNPFNPHVELTLTDLGRPQTILAPPAAQVAAIGI